MSGAAAADPFGSAASAVAALADALEDVPPLVAMRSLSVLRLAVVDDLTACVVAARARGDSWQAIGDALGVSRQAAQQLYGRLAPPPPPRPPQVGAAEVGDGCHP